MCAGDLFLEVHNYAIDTVFEQEQKQSLLIFHFINVCTLDQVLIKVLIKVKILCGSHLQMVQIIQS